MHNNCSDPVYWLSVDKWLHTKTSEFADDFSFDRRWNVFPTLKENDIRVIVCLPNTIQRYKSLGLGLFDVRKKKMQDKLPPAAMFWPSHSSKGLFAHWGKYLLRWMSKMHLTYFSLKLVLRRHCILSGCEKKSSVKMTGSSQFPIITAPWTRYDSEARSHDINGLSVMKKLS
jgi:hypothetical protein